MTDQNVPEVSPDPSPTNGVIVARAYRNYRLTRIGLGLFLIYFGGASIRDGFYRYPAENEAAQKQHLERLPHPGFDVQFNKLFGILLPPIGVMIIGWAFYASRGEFRFDGVTLTAPGHPAVPITAITEIDRSKWDRKSIAYILYKIPETGASGKIKIDHSRYDPIDKLFKHLEIAMEGMAGLTFVSPPAESTGLDDPSTDDRESTPGQRD